MTWAAYRVVFVLHVQFSQRYRTLRLAYRFLIVCWLSCARSASLYVKAVTRPYVRLEMAYSAGGYSTATSPALAAAAAASPAATYLVSFCPLMQRNYNTCLLSSWYAASFDAARCYPYT